MAQHTIDLPCIADTYIDEANPNTSYGSSTTLKSGGQLAGMLRAHVIMKFNNTILPARKKIISRKLRFYVTNNVGGYSDCILWSPAIAITWGEGIAWNNAPSELKTWGSQYSLAIGASFIAGAYAECAADLSANITNPENFGMLLCWQPHQGLTTEYLTIQSREGANPPMLRIIYEDVPPDAPTPQSPIGEYRDNKATIHFAWQYNSSVGGTQKKFDLQWSADQVNWTTVSQTTANNYYDMPENTLPAGNIYWRVRCYNEYDEVGPYCSVQSFYAIGAPAAPTINPIQTNSARPVVSWSAFGQQVYQLQVLSGDTVIYDSGNVPSITIRQHKVMAWLSDGAYTIRLRIKNEYSLWSEWGQASVTIATVKPAKPEFSVAKTQYGVRAKASVNDVNYSLLYRDGKCIGKQAIKSITENLVRNGNGEEGIGYWTIEYSSGALSVVNNRFKFTSDYAYARYVQKVPVKPNTNYYLSGNLIADTSAITMGIRTLDGIWLSPAATYGRSFNTGNNSYIFVALRNEGAGTSYFDSIMLVEGTTAPTIYKSYVEDYIINDNAVANGHSYEFKARAVQGIPERSITNILGSDGDCEDVSKYITTGVLALNSSDKVFGLNSIKITSTVNDQVFMLKESGAISLDPTKYLLVSAYFKNGTATFGVRIFKDNNGGGIVKASPAVTSTTGFVRVGLRLQPSEFNINNGFIMHMMSTITGQYAYVDGIMFNEITKEDFENLTDAELLAKYPFGNNTFTTPAYEVYNDSDPVSVVAEFRNALITSVSDLSNVFAFTRSLNSPPKRVHDSSPGGAFVHYAGRKHSVWEPDEHISAGLSCGAFYLETLADVDAFDAIYYLNGTVLYRDAKGRKIYGVLTNRQVIEERSGYTVSFVVNQVDYNEELEV